MADAMVTARMSATRKNNGNKILKDLGTTPSAAINKLYELIIENRALPWDDAASAGSGISAQDWSGAAAFIDSIPKIENSRFASMTDDEIRRERLAARGLMEREL